jgi:hypothetical protein
VLLVTAALDSVAPRVAGGRTAQMLRAGNSTVTEIVFPLAGRADADTIAGWVDFYFYFLMRSNPICFLSCADPVIFFCFFFLSKG